jgi:coenzyme F420 hydrogenase subunit beta
MNTFFDLIQKVQKPGLCHRCGGCVTFCTAVNYGALKLDEDGKPYYDEIEKCIECGLCHAICPEIDEFEEATKEMVGWEAPIGKVFETTVARAINPVVRGMATDGGVVTALLLHLFDYGRIDGAIVTKQTGPFQRQPCLAVSRKDIKEAAGFHFDTSHGMKSFSDRYLTYNSIEELSPMVKKGLHRVAMVGTPCQIKAIRKMEVLDIIPSDSIKFCLGLFCSGNFVFNEEAKDKISSIDQFDWNDVKKINIKDNFMVYLKNGEVKAIPLQHIEFMKRYACRYCPDYSAEFSDISFGGIGAEEGWTSVITRTPLGRAIFADAKGNAIEEYNYNDNKNFATQAISKIRIASANKKKTARHNRRELGNKSVAVKE